MKNVAAGISLCHILSEFRMLSEGLPFTSGGVEAHRVVFAFAVTFKYFCAYGACVLWIG